MGHLGGIHAETGRWDAYTARRGSGGYAAARRLAKAWGVGSSHGRGWGSGLHITARLQVLRAGVLGLLTTDSRSIPWRKQDIRWLQRVANYAVGVAFGMDVFLMQNTGFSDAQMYRVARWPTVEG